MNTMVDVPWKQERFKRMKEAKLVRDSLLQNSKCYGVHIYHGHRHLVVRWKENSSS